jgi:hypothetical protein
MTNEPEFTEEEIETIRELLPRARTFDSPEAIKAAIEDPRNEVIYALAPDEGLPLGHGFIIIKGINKLRDLLSTKGGYATELVIKCADPGEALWVFDQFGEKNTLQ